MELDTPYLLVTCMSTGSTWSECVSGMEFSTFMSRTFGNLALVAAPIAGQEAEFCCGYPIGASPNCMYKSGRASQESRTTESPRVLLSVRGVQASKGLGRSTSQWSKTGFKVWIAIQVSDITQIPTLWSNDRASATRRRPEEIKIFLDEARLAALRSIVLPIIQEKQDQVLAKEGYLVRKEAGKAFRSMIGLVKRLRSPPQPVAASPSTVWDGDGDEVLAPADILRYQCICCQEESLGAQVSTDCKGLAFAFVNGRTVYGHENEVIPAVRHCMKSRLLLHLRESGINRSDVLRVKVHENGLDACSIICRFADLQNQWDSASLQVSTDKHRVLWMIQKDVIEDAQTVDQTYNLGRLYIIKAAPKMDFSTRIMFEPRVLHHGEYIAVVLEWVGNMVFQHQALNRIAHGGEASLGLGILRSLFPCDREWHGAQIHCSNVFYAQVDPEGDNMRRILHQRSMQLSPDQRSCLQFINNEVNPVLSIQAFAGTGKTKVVALLIQVAKQDICREDEAVVLLTPSRHLRDSFLQSPDFVNYVFPAEDMAREVTWLGRQSESPGALCSWEDTVRQMVDKTLSQEIWNLQYLEQRTLRPLFLEIQSSDLLWQIQQMDVVEYINDPRYAKLQSFRVLANKHMTQVVKLKEQKAAEIEKLLASNDSGHLIVSTLDAFVKWRAGDMKGLVDKRLQRKELKMCFLEEAESADVQQVIAAFGNKKSAHW